MTGCHTSFAFVSICFYRTLSISGRTRINGLRAQRTRVVRLITTQTVHVRVGLTDRIIIGRRRLVLMLSGHLALQLLVVQSVLQAGGGTERATLDFHCLRKTWSDIYRP